MTTTDTPRIDEGALEQFVHQAVGDLAAAISGLMLASATVWGSTGRWPARGR